MQSLNDLAQWLSVHPWLVLVSVGCSIVGIPLTIVFFILARRVRKLVYRVTSNTILRNLESQVPGCSISYEGHGSPVENLTVSRVALWNDGRETIRKEDIVKKDALCIRANKPDQIFLNLKILTCSTQTNALQCTINRDKSEIKISFDYLDHKQGAVLQIVHTGLGSDSIAIYGTIMGNGTPKRLGSPLSFTEFADHSYLADFIPLARRALILLFISFGTIILLFADTLRDPKFKFADTAVALLYILFGLIMIATNIYRNIPKDLREAYGQELG